MGPCVWKMGGEQVDSVKREDWCDVGRYLTVVFVYVYYGSTVDRNSKGLFT